ncbi:MAG: type IV pilus twitching motility protein PilT [Planctomycetota bacterium]
MPELEKLLDEVVNRRASDIHLTVGLPPTLRIHGRLRPLEGPPLTEADTRALVERIAPRASLEELEREGTSDLAIAHGQERFRVSVYRQRGFYAAALRLIPSRILSLEEIGLPPSVKDLLARPRGLVLVTGPTGSGKTTTLASMVDHINSTTDCHIITIEDPIEYYHHHKKSIITQRELHHDVPGFAEALRRALRQDPDVILMGEMRDLETISAAITAAETGHLVLGTLHTTGSARTVDRIIDAFPPEQQEQIRAQLAVSIIAVISQVLMPRLDREGVVAGFEIMMMTPAIENHIRKNETFKITSAIQTSRRLGMVLLDDFLLELHQQGKIDRQSALIFAQDPKELAPRLGG